MLHKKSAKYTLLLIICDISLSNVQDIPTIGYNRLTKACFGPFVYPECSTNARGRNITLLTMKYIFLEFVYETSSKGHACIFSNNYDSAPRTSTKLHQED